MKALLTVILLVTCALIVPAQTSSAQPSPTDSEQARQLFEAAQRALLQRQFDEAIRLYDQALALMPRQPVLWSNKAAALMERAAATYNSAILTGVDEATRKARMEAFRNDLREAARNAAKGVEVVRSISEAEVEPGVLGLADALRSALRVRAEAMFQLALRVDIANAPQSLKAIHEYLEAETDDAQILHYQLRGGQMMLEARQPQHAFEEFQKALVLEPDNAEALLGSSVALLDLWFMTNDQARWQEGLAYLKRFVDDAPDSHRLKGPAEETLSYLKQPLKPAVKSQGVATVIGGKSEAGSGDVNHAQKAEAAGIINGKAVSKPAPVYPAIAKWARIIGPVAVHITVDEKGDVRDATAVSGHPLLRGAAVSAALQARFTPTLLEGKPVSVAGIITYNFTLQ